MTQKGPVSLGDIIEVYCLRCRLNLDANVAVLHEGEIKRVQCRTCGNFVDYRPPEDLQAKKDKVLKRLVSMQEKKRKTAGPSPTPVPAGAGVERQRWAQLTDQVDSRSAKPYDPRRTYKVGDFILHKGRGMGHIESSTPEDRTMVALFRDGLLQLAQNEPVED